MLNFWEKLGIGVTAGVIVGTWVGYLASLAAGQVVAWPAVVAFIAICLSFIIKTKVERPTKIFLITLMGWGMYLVKLFSQMLVEKADGIWAGGSNVWGDWAGHMGYVANWIFGNNFPTQNPWYSGIRLSYPFLFDFTSALLMKSGVSQWQVFSWPGAVMAIVLVILLFCLTVRITKNQAAAAIAVAIFMLSGGLGFLLIPHNKELTHSYEANIQWVNFIISEMVPQRGILVGINVALAVFILWHVGWEENKKKYFLLAGILAGLLPFFHTHSYLAIVGVSGFLFLLRPRRIWWYFFIPAGLLALPQLAYFTPQIRDYAPGFIRWQPGWTAHVQKDNWVWFWIKNIGLAAILIPVAWVTAWKKDQKIFWLYLPFVIIFAVASLWIFQPWENDNSKLLRFWYLGSAILIGWWLARIPKVLAIICLVILTLAGTIDAGSWLDFSKNKLQMWSQADIELADRVRQLTPKTAVFLTNDNHNHWVVDLAGRKIVLGFRGWLWSWGINYSSREADVRKMFMGDPQTPQFLTQYGIDYVIIGPGEKSNFNASESYYLSHYPLLLDGNGQKIFDVREQR